MKRARITVTVAAIALAAALLGAQPAGAAADGFQASAAPGDSTSGPFTPATDGTMTGTDVSLPTGDAVQLTTAPSGRLGRSSGPPRTQGWEGSSTPSTWTGRRTSCRPPRSAGSPASGRPAPST